MPARRFLTATMTSDQNAKNFGSDDATFPEIESMD